MRSPYCNFPAIQSSFFKFQVIRVHFSLCTSIWNGGIRTPSHCFACQSGALQSLDTIFIFFLSFLYFFVSFSLSFSLSDVTVFLLLLILLYVLLYSVHLLVCCLSSLSTRTQNLRVLLLFHEFIYLEMFKICCLIIVIQMKTTKN